MDQHSDPTTAAGAPPAPERDGRAAADSFGGWTVEDIQRQANAIWAQAQGQLAEIRLAAAQMNRSAEAQLAETAQGAEEGAGQGAASAHEAGPELLAAGAKSLFGEMVASQHQASRASTAELLQRVFSIYGLTPPTAPSAGGPLSGGPAAPPTRASAPESAQKES
jgi:hypothetical protein